MLGELARGNVGAGVETDDHRFRSERQVDVGFGDAPDRGVHDVDLHLVGGELRERHRQGLVAALHVSLDDERERLDLVVLQLREQVPERIVRRVARVADQLLGKEREHDHDQDRERCALEEPTHGKSPGKVRDRRAPARKRNHQA